MPDTNAALFLEASVLYAFRLFLDVAILGVRWLYGLLLIVIFFSVGAVFLYWIIRRILHVAGKVGDVVVTAFATGGLSLLSENPRADLMYDYPLTEVPAGPRGTLALVLDAFATGGVSLFAVTQRVERDRDDERPVAR